MNGGFGKAFYMKSNSVKRGRSLFYFWLPFCLSPFAYPFCSTVKFRSENETFAIAFAKPMALAITGKSIRNA